MTFRILLALVLLVMAAPAFAQSDALNLPTDLYVLLNEGVVQRYGLGAAGISNVTPDDTFVIDFGISPDGTRIAYRTDAGMNIAMVDVVGTTQMVDALAGVPPSRGRADTVVWSPSGDAVAYTNLEGARVYFTNLGVSISIPQSGLVGLSWSPDGRFLVAEAEGNIWWIYRRDGTSFALQAAIPSSLGTAWINASQLAFAPADGGLFLMNLDDANRQTPLADANSEFRLPFGTADGRLLVFQRLKDDETVPEGFGQLVVRLPDSPTLEVVGLTAIDLQTGLRWAPNGELVIAFQGGVLALFDPSTGQGLSLPITNAVAYAWGPYPPVTLTTDVMPTPEAIFPEQFPTLDPATQIPGLPTALPLDVTPKATAAIG